ncbi:sensor histidine kinase [Paenibacillus sp. HWE-109]|uniref:cache domain-containing sensor histidine kinase n=1 Tax=Paenibacillus sp. HWE-109 TaxID=1306526 RepID=UPI001EDCBC52|nr:sensor histidine kinase [Paenibacillus sp. HWE-109]UKS29265.1 sensor histidine kinase [Paenibacillus sp. HWE-109]
MRYRGKSMNGGGNPANNRSKAQDFWTRIRKLLTGFIQVRLMCYFLLILLPISGFSLFAIVKSQMILEVQTGERTQGALHTMADYIDLTLQNIEQLSSLIAFDMNINTTLQSIGQEPDKQSFVQLAQVMDQITNMTTVNLTVDQITIIHMPSRTVISTKIGGRKLPEGVEKQEWYIRLMEASGGTVFYTPQDSESYFDTDSVHLIRTMDPYNRTLMNPNLLVISIKKTALIELAKPLLPSKNANIYLFDSDGSPITGTGARVNPQVWKQEHDIRSVRRSPQTGTEMVTISVKSKFSGWSLMMEQPLWEIRSHTDSLKVFTYGIVVVSVVLAILISWIVYRGFSAPLRKLAYGMKQLRTGNFTIQLEDTRVDELGYVIESFNRMAENQKSLIRDHYEKQLLLSKMELKFLQSQINPHFLYNTLDSIYWTAKNYDADEISEMVLNLSRFFRLSLNKGNETFPVSETIMHLTYYIKVQQLRFLDHFTVRYEIAKESEPYHVLKLLLQPLVENAVLHGLEKQSTGGELIISSYTDGNLLVFEVADNGVGVNKAKLAYIRAKLEESAKLAAEGISTDRKRENDLFGLRNVIARMKMYYGDEAEFAFESEENQGTRMTLRLPLDKCLKPVEDQAV